MFHQVEPADKPLLRFIWRDMKQDEKPSVYEWQVLPCGTTCSPCCVIYALQHHARNHQDSEIRNCIAQSFNVDKCLDSVPTVDQGCTLVEEIFPLHWRI